MKENESCEEEKEKKSWKDDVRRIAPIRSAKAECVVVVFLVFVTGLCLLDVIAEDLVTVASHVATAGRASVLVVVPRPDLQAVIIAETNGNRRVREVLQVFAFLCLSRITDETFHLLATRGGIAVHDAGG